MDGTKVAVATPKKFVLCPMCSTETRACQQGGATVYICEMHGDTRFPDANWWKPKPQYPVPEFFVRGYDLFDEWARLTPPEQIRMFFDVGANIGQSTTAVKQAFPGCEVHAFEAVRSTFETLDARFRAFPDIHSHNIALSSSAADLYIVKDEHSVNNQVAASPAPNAEKVSATTGDDFCKANSIASIDYLKIDTEGHDREVLRGFRNMLAEGRIRYVEVEAGMNRLNKKHVFFADLCQFIDSVSDQFDLFGIYEQVRETANGSPLRRSNLVFKRRPQP